MSEYRSNNIDPRPKRRKDKENPYTIFTVGIETNRPSYYLSFQNSQGVSICMEIDKSLFELLDRFELEDLSFLNEMDNHRERFELSEKMLNARLVQKQETVEDIVFRQLQNEMLHKAILQLPEIQRRRLVLYYFGNFTYEQIAEMEGCKHPAIIKSIKAAISNLKKYFSK